MPTDDEFQRLQVYLKGVFADAPDELASLSQWAPAVDIMMINGVAWTHAITEREALRLEYVQFQRENSKQRRKKEQNLRRKLMSSLSGCIKTRK